MPGIWYGLTKEEAASRSRDMGFGCRFDTTMDPRAEGAVPGAAQEPSSRSQRQAALIPKVIRAREEGGVMVFLLGYFAPPKH